MDHPRDNNVNSSDFPLEKRGSLTTSTTFSKAQTSNLHESANDLKPQQQQQQQNVLTEIPAPPDGGWGWVICFASFACNFILDGIAYSFGILLIPLMEYFQSNRSSVAWVGSLLAGVYMTSGPLVGGLVNKFGCRPVCMVGGVVACSSLMLSTFSPNVEVLMLTYGIMGGFGLGLIYLPAVIACGYYFEKRRALATGISVCGSGVGCFVFPPLANIFVTQFGWKGANMIFAGFCLFCCVFGALMRPLELAIELAPKHEDEDEDVDEENEDLDGRKRKRLDSTISESTSFIDHRSRRASNPLSTSTSVVNVNLPTITEMGGSTPPPSTSEATAAPSIVIDEVSNNGKPPSFSSSVVLGSRRRTIADNLSVSRQLNAAGFPRNRSASRLEEENKFGRKYSVGRLSRIDDIDEPVFVTEGGAGSKFHLEPTGHCINPRPIIRPMSRKDIFYSGSVYKLAMEDSEEVSPSTAMDRYRHSVISIPRSRYSSLPRGSIVASHISIPKGYPQDDDLFDDELHSPSFPSSPAKEGGGEGGIKEEKYGVVHSWSTS